MRPASGNSHLSETPPAGGDAWAAYVRRLETGPDLPGSAAPLPNAPDAGRADAIRGAAALVVAVAHMWQIFLYPYAPDALVFRILGGMAGWSVAVFFLLSGILIALSIRRRSAGSFALSDYLLARVVRIFPPLVAAVIVTIGCVAIIRVFGLYGSETYLMPGDLAAARARAEFEWSAVLPTLLLTYWLVPSHGYLFFNGPLWSLSYEFWAYVVAGLCAGALLRRSWALALPAAALIGWILLFAYSFFPTVLIVWGMGFAAGTGWRAIERWPTACLAAVAAACLGIAIAAAGDELAVLLVDGRANAVFYIGVSAALLACLTLILRKGGRRNHCESLLIAASHSSYTLYLIHFPLMLLCLSLFRPIVHPFGLAAEALLAVLSLGFSILAAHHLARLVENRMLWRRLIARAWPANRAAATAA
jgi:peptidoglycan/LPS O-acetylase OafA/YrhL